MSVSWPGCPQWWLWRVYWQAFSGHSPLSVGGSWGQVWPCRRRGGTEWHPVWSSCGLVTLEHQNCPKWRHFCGERERGEVTRMTMTYYHKCYTHKCTLSNVHYLSVLTRHFLGCLHCWGQKDQLVPPAHLWTFPVREKSKSDNNHITAMCHLSLPYGVGAAVLWCSPGRTEPATVVHTPRLCSLVCGLADQTLSLRVEVYDYCQGPSSLLSHPVEGSSRNTSN